MEKDNVESNMKPRFLVDRLGIMGLVVGRKRERGIDYFRGLLRKTNKNIPKMQEKAPKRKRRYHRVCANGVVCQRITC